MKLKDSKIIGNPFLLFLPFFFLYLVVILIFTQEANFGDENRYLMYANNLIHGFYTLPAPYLDLGNGPGYSLIITPFVALHFPLITIKLMNALFYYFSIILLFKSLQRFVTFKIALIVSIVWALYPNTFEQLPYALPEVFASSLIPLLMFLLILAFNKDDSKKTYKYVILTGVTFGFLALTKPIFGYVLLFMIGGAILLWIVNKRNVNFKKSVTLLAIAFVITIPWLAYTYHMTGKMLYWSSYGGNNLYWMSSPYENEYGDWQPYPWPYHEKLQLPGTLEIVKLQHEKDFQQIFESKEAQDLYVKNGNIHGNAYTGVIQDDTLKRIAFNNILSHPTKFIENIISNAGRMFFNYPNSYTIQKPSTLKRLPINGTILVFAVFCFVISLVNWKRILFPLRFLLFFSLLYFSGSLLGSAGPRMFTVIVPVLLFWIAYIFQRTVKIKVRFSEDRSASNNNNNNYG
jgi:4-amino-4-deoxy-L-arabinose transferase-like glycosyltransferase